MIHKDVLLDIDGFRQNLAGIIFGQSLTAGVINFCNWPPGAKLLPTEGEKLGILALLKGFLLTLVL